MITFISCHYRINFQSYVNSTLRVTVTGASKYRNALLLMRMRVNINVGNLKLITIHSELWCIYDKIRLFCHYSVYINKYILSTDIFLTQITK